MTAGTAVLGDAIALRRVKRAYEQIADQLRDLIVVGTLKPGARLPTETELAEQLGVSRATVREALRSLMAEGLVRTEKGSTGGTFVAQPSIARVSSYLSTNICLLSDSDELSLAEVLEARELLEVPAARLAADRCTHDGIARLRASIPEGDATARLPTSEQFEMNRDFHTTIVEMSSNALLTLAAKPIFTVLQTRLARSTLGHDLHRTISEHHVAIVSAVESGDADRAGDLMAEHLAWLRPAYERAWRSLKR
jgi:DNA-binding FadR family transcriptional regulator